jgi:2-keto-3-deoxy-L-fuconate dehydrogenase
MSNQNFSGKRVLITQADRFMGPVLCEVFAKHGATVIASTDRLVSAGAPASVVTEAGHIDVLIACEPVVQNLLVFTPSKKPRG